MKSQRVFHRITRRGKLLRVVREHYLRDDIGCGASACPLCSQHPDGAADDFALLAAKPHNDTYLVLDTNAVLHQIDVLERDVPPLCDVVLLQTVAEEVRHRNLAVYNRLMALLRDHRRRFFLFSNEHHRETYAGHNRSESPNDRNDRAIRLAAQWYASHVEPLGVKVLLVTNDRANLQSALKEGIAVTTMRKFVMSLKEHPDLQEVLAASAEDDSSGAGAGAGAGASAGSGRGVGVASHYRPHLPLSTIQQGLKTRKFYSGALRVNRDSWSEGRVSVEARNGDVISVSISGDQAVNRGTEGDIVAIQVDSDLDECKTGEDGVPTGPPPSGRVVGIIKRNWRALCGSLEPADGAFSRGKSVSSCAAVVVLWRCRCRWCDGVRLVHTPRVFGVQALVRPVDGRFPMVRIETRQKEALMDKRIVMAIDSWPPTAK